MRDKIRKEQERRKLADERGGGVNASKALLLQHQKKVEKLIFL